MANISVNTHADNVKILNELSENYYHPEGKGDSKLGDCNSPPGKFITAKGVIADSSMKEFGNEQDNEKSEIEESASDSSEADSSKQITQETLIKRRKTPSVPHFKSNGVYSW